MFFVFVVVVFLSGQREEGKQGSRHVSGRGSG